MSDDGQIIKDKETDTTKAAIDTIDSKDELSSISNEIKDNAEVIESVDFIAKNNADNDLVTNLKIAETKAAEHYDAMLRAIAEKENARRRAQEDIARAHKYALEKFAEHLLPVMDSMHAALADDVIDASKMRIGIELTMKQLTTAFEKIKIAELNPLGEKFDPNYHQAISTVNAETEAQVNTVVTVLQRGYILADRVLRPALVVVAQTAKTNN